MARTIISNDTQQTKESHFSINNKTHPSQFSFFKELYFLSTSLSQDLNNDRIFAEVK